MSQPKLVTLVGRSSSHFTRVARIFAAELEVAYELEVAHDLMARDPAAFGGNPALKMPVLRDSNSAWYGTLPICRELQRRSQRPVSVVWPEDLEAPDASNAQELIAQAMATEVSLILARLEKSEGTTAHLEKMSTSLEGSMRWLDAHLNRVLSLLPTDRALSYLEVTLFCLIDHLGFRSVLNCSPYSALMDFKERFSSRSSASSTAFCFDPPPGSDLLSTAAKGPR